MPASPPSYRRRGGPGKDKISQAKGSEAASIRAKRRASGIERIQAKAANGQAHAERGYVQMGRMNTAILAGHEDLSTWSDEELRRGQKKDKNGRWQGRRPSVVPKALHDELVRRTLSKAEELMRDNLHTAVEALVDVVTGEDVEDKDRLRAIAMIMDRVMGKEPQRVEVGGDAPWMAAIAAAIVGTVEDEDIIDVEPEEEDDYDD